MPVNPAQNRHQGCRPLHRHRRGWRHPDDLVTPHHSTPSKGNANPFAGFDATFAQRKRADDFYAGIIPPSMSADQAAVMRQAPAGMLLTKQYYYYDVDRWLDEHQATPCRAAAHCAQPRLVVSRGSTMTSSLCPTSGNILVRGVDLGSWDTIDRAGARSI